MISVISDLHLNPGDTPPKFPKGKIILLGDCLNFLPYGMSAWETSKGQNTIEWLAEGLPNGAVYCYGNHEGNIGWLKEMFKPYPKIRVVREFEVMIGKQKWHFEHGHRFSLDWSWLQWIADDLTQFFVRLAPKQWYWVMRRLGWMPSKTQDNPKKYDKLAWTVWRNGLNYAIKNKCNLCIGHTHSPADIELGIGVTLLDCGAEQVITL